ncbi:hypothetical protein [Hanstruepera flava]|uniref:hypothetical protein n=1 Tax=Hanstruepera flava TaxID=2930218 RepID=UPI00202843EB|nr:hypothetical protein [Hanstruepera flava]
MKYLFCSLFLLISIIGFSQNQEIKLTKEELLSKPIQIPNSCFGLSPNDSFPKIVSFKIKIPKFPAQQVYGDYLYNNSKAYLKKALIGDFVTIFDIKLSEEDIVKPPKSIVIEIVSKKE